MADLINSLEDKGQFIPDSISSSSNAAYTHTHTHFDIPFHQDPCHKKL